MHVNEKELEQYLKVLVMFRNMCAHNERLFSSYAHSDIPDTVIHKKLKIPQTGEQYIYGKRDLFSLVIAFRYLLPKEDFLVFKKILADIIVKYMKNSNRLGETELLKCMGFPLNWKDITRYKLFFKSGFNTKTLDIKNSVFLLCKASAHTQNLL